MYFVGFSSVLESFGGFMGSIFGIFAIFATVCMKDKIIGRLRPIIENYSIDRSATEEFTDD